MKKIFLAIILVAFASSLFAQTAKSKTLKNNVAAREHKVVIQLSSEDTLVHKSLLRQLNNILTAAPGSKIEVVCHGPGINMLVTDKTTVHSKIEEMKIKGVLFMACENTLRERNISKDKIIPGAGFVPSALVEIITRQEEGWSYIKSGF